MFAQDVAIFEQGARHVAKDIVGKGIANPTALLLSTSMLLRHVQMHTFADRYSVHSVCPVSLPAPVVTQYHSESSLSDSIAMLMHHDERSMHTVCALPLQARGCCHGRHRSRRPIHCDT